MAKTAAKKKPKPPTAKANGTTHVCLVLDRSGSMQARHTDALGGVNSYIETARKDKALQESRLSLITFNNVSIEMARKDEVIGKVKELDGSEYRCEGWTPLYDAIGKSIGILDEALANDHKAGKKKNGGKAVLVVMTDGMENASKEFSRDRITQLIKDREKDGWLIIFLGEGLGVAKQGVDIGTHSANSVSYTAAGLRASGQALGQSIGRYASASTMDMQMEASENALTEAEKRMLQVGREAVKARRPKA